MAIGRNKVAYRIDSAGKTVQVGNVQNKGQLNAGRVVLPGIQESFGSVVDVGASSGLLNYFSFQLDNSAGVATRKFFFGAETARLMIDPTLLQATGISVSMAVFERVLEVASVGVRLMNMITSSNPVQYQQKINYYAGCDLNGQAPFYPVAMPLVQRNNQFQLDIQTIKPSGSDLWVFDWQGGMTFEVLAGEVLTIAAEPGELGNR